MHTAQAQMKNTHGRYSFLYKKMHFLSNGDGYYIQLVMSWLEKETLEWPLTQVSNKDRMLTVRGPFRKLISFSSCLLSVYLIHILCDPMGKFFNYGWGKSHRVTQDVNWACAEVPSGWKINPARWVSLSVCHKFHTLPPEVHVHRALASLDGRPTEGQCSHWLKKKNKKQLFWSIPVEYPESRHKKQMSAVNQRQTVGALPESSRIPALHTVQLHFSISCGECAAHHFPYRKKESKQPSFLADGNCPISTDQAWNHYWFNFP